MKKSIKAGALLIAGVFVLSGCGGSDGDSGSASAESPSASPAPKLAVGQDQYTAAELEEALVAVKTAEGLEGEVQKDEELRPDLEPPLQTPEGITFTPGNCVALGAVDSIGMPDGDVIAASTVAALEVSEEGMVVVASYSDASVLDQQLEEATSLLDECAEFEMKGDEEGQSAVGTVEELEASTEAPTTLATKVTLATEGRERSLTKIAAVSGTTNILFSIDDTSDPEAAMAEAEETINAVLAELENK